MRSMGWQHIIGLDSDRPHVRYRLRSTHGPLACWPRSYPTPTLTPGNVISISVPAFTALLIAKRARFASAGALSGGGPSPVPPEPWRVEVASWRNGSNRDLDLLLGHARAGVAHAQQDRAEEVGHDKDHRHSKDEIIVLAHSRCRYIRIATRFVLELRQ